VQAGPPAAARRRVEQSDDVLAVVSRNRDKFIEDTELVFLRASPDTAPEPPAEISTGCVLTFRAIVTSWSPQQW
jgi:hypothetical protein